MQVKIENVKLKMVEGITLPESKKSEVTGKFEKTGQTIPAYTYTFISDDDFAEKLVFTKPVSKANYKEFEDKIVNIILDIKYDEYGRKLKISLDSVSSK